MNKNLATLLIMVTVGFFIAGNSLADEVRLRNGDKLTGQVVRIETDKLILKTTYAGEITIAWKEVASIGTDDSVKVVLKDETTV